MNQRDNPGFISTIQKNIIWLCGTIKITDDLNSKWITVFNNQQQQKKRKLLLRKKILTANIRNHVKIGFVDMKSGITDKTKLAVCIKKDLQSVAK